MCVCVCVCVLGRWREGTGIKRTKWEKKEGIGINEWELRRKGNLWAFLGAFLGLFPLLYRKKKRNLKKESLAFAPSSSPHRSVFFPPHPLTPPFSLFLSSSFFFLPLPFFSPLIHKPPSPFFFHFRFSFFYFLSYSLPSFLFLLLRKSRKIGGDREVHRTGRRKAKRRRGGGGGRGRLRGEKLGRKEEGVIPIILFFLSLLTSLICFHTGSYSNFFFPFSFSFFFSFLFFSFYFSFFLLLFLFIFIFSF